MVKTSRPPATALRWGLMLAALLGVGACTTVQHGNPGEQQPVRRVRHDGTPEQERLARHVREFGNEWYPKLCELLLDETATPPRQFDVVFKPLKSGNLGLANLRSRRIYLNASSFTNQLSFPENFNKVYAHELAHMAAQTAHWTLPFWNARSPAEKYWGESIAEFARFTLLGTNGWAGPECNSRYPHYTDGYACGGAFLLFVEAGHGTNVVRQLIRELRERSYAEPFFERTTGSSLEQLWSEFQLTSAFRPGAAEALRIREALGFEEGQPPKDVLARFQRMVEPWYRSNEPPALQLQFDPKQPPPIAELIQLHVYNTQPGGPPEQALREWYRRGALPGIQSTDTATPIGPSSHDDLEVQHYPKTHTIRLRKEGDPSVYRYRVVSRSLESGWKLEAAARLAADGSVIEELPVN